MFIYHNGHHSYTLCSSGLTKDLDEIFATREAAMACMYQTCKENSIHIQETYDDKHDKTYICNNGVRFFIQRM